MTFKRGAGYRARIVLDSVGPSGKRLTTFELRYPRFVHAELLTHRLFSRNSASSRAIPVEKMIAQVENEPAMPVWWGKNQKGMQAREELQGDALRGSERMWLLGRDEAVRIAWAMISFGAHKQIVNRVLEPWMFITTLVSATEFDNWFGLRDHEDAQPEIAWVARLMRESMDASTPNDLNAGEWHLPFVDNDPGFVDDFLRLGEQEDRRFVSAGRCARVSYLTHDGRRDPAADVELAMKLKDSGHWSPFEHVAQALERAEQSGNFCGWRQMRKMFPDEHIGGPRA